MKIKFTKKLDNGFRITARRNFEGNQISSYSVDVDKVIRSWFRIYAFWDIMHIEVESKDKIEEEIKLVEYFASEIINEYLMSNKCLSKDGWY